MARLLAALALAGALVASSFVVGATPASAASASRLCSTYAGCAALGMTNHGYENTKRSYWGMYAGHNCTNYAAYMMVRAGFPNARPFSTSGDAWGWGHGSKHVNRTPTVGSVAWWDGDGKDNLGHVAYVEAVLSSTEVIISEDSWGGEFGWRVVTAESGWPDRFIHYRDSRDDGVVPAYRASPQGFAVFTEQWQQLDPGYVKQGTPLWLQVKFQNTGTATWRGLKLGIPSGSSALVPGDRVAVQQQEAVATGEWASFQFAVSIPPDATDGATLSTTFQPVGAGIGWIARSKNTVTLRADSRSWFWQSPQPWIAGTPQQGQVLTANLGEWAPQPVALRIDWLRNGSKIAGAHAATYALREADVGTSVSVEVSAAASGFIPTTRTSGGTAVVSSADGNTLSRSSSLGRGDQLVSSNGAWRVVQASSGRLLVQNRFTKKVAWSSGRVGSVRTSLRRDGNLVSYSRGGTAVFSTGTRKASSATVTNSGKLVLRAPSGRILWSSAKH